MLEEMLRGGNRGIVGFDPTTIPGCTVWFDAADPGTMSTSVSSVQTWRSKGSASCTATYKYNAPSVSTIGGLSTLYFNGVSTMMTTNAVASYGATETTWITCATSLATVSASTPADACPIIATQGAGAERSIRYTCNVNATAYSINTSVLRQTTGDNTNGVRGFIDTAAYFAGFTNGALIASNTTAVTFQPGYNQSFVMGQWNVGWLNGYIYEILIYNRALSLGEYQSVEGYLSQKWGFSPAKVFTPRSIPGCSIWFDAADMSSLTTSGTNITSWTNKGSIPLVAYPLTGGLGTPVGGGTNSNAFGGFLTTGASINGLNAVNCPQQTTYGMSSTVTFPTQARAVFAVYRAASAGAAPYITFFGCLTVVPNNQNGMANYIRNDGQEPTLFAEVGAGAGSILQAVPASGTFPTNTTNMVAWVQSATSTGNNFITMNGVSQTLTTNQLATTYVTTPQYYFIGSAYTQAYTFCEYIMFNSEISISQRQAVEGYLAWKWGFQGSLGVTHPNYLTTGNFVRSLTLATTHPYYSLPPATRAFTPLDVPGCTLWLDGADSATIIGNVTSVREKANNVTFTATGTVTTSTIGTTQSLNFAGAGYLSGTVNNLLVGTSFVVFRTTAANNGYYPFFTWRDNVVNSGLANFPAFGYLPGGNLIGPYTTWVGAGTPTTSVSIGNSYITSYSWSGTTTNVGFNGAIPTTGTQSAYAHSETLLWIAFDNGYYTTANIGEILIYNSILSAAQRQAIEGYLANKWGLKASIPVFANPTSIPSCALWLDGADSTTMFQNTAGTTPITADGQTIAAWRDKSANRYLFIQPTTANQPVYKTGIRNGSSITRWNGTSTGLQSSTTLPFYTSASSGGSFFFVFMVTSNNTQRFLMTYQNQTSETFCVSESEIGCPTGNSDAGNFGIHQGCGKANVALNQITTNTYVMMNLNLLSSGTAPANTTIFKNGTSASMTAQNGGFYSGTTYPSANNARNLNIGYRIPVGSFPIDCWLAGDIAEIVWYQTPLSSAQQQQVEGYLAWKWGLQASLPATHPFYATVPVPHPFNKVPPTIRQPVLYSDVAPGNWVRDWQPYLRALTRANAGATQNIGSITGGGTYTSYGWFGNVLAPNGNIYFVPYGSSNILVLNTNTGVTTNITGGATFTTFNQYRGGVLASNGNIYCVPFASTNILVINPNTGVTSNMTGSATFTSFGWHGGVLGPDGNIYCAPANALNILVIRPATGTTSNLTGGATYPGAGAWAGGVLAPNGNIYFAPNAATNILVLNTMTGVTSNLTGGATYSGSWTGGVLATNGNIYFCPYTASNVLVLNPATGVTSNLVGGASYPGGGAWAGGVLAPNGNIYFPPSGGATNILVVDPIAGTTSTLTSGVIGSSAWQGGVLAPNGTIYFTPLIATTILTVSFTGLLQTPSLNYCMSAYTNKL